MLKLHKSKFRDQYNELFSQESVELKKEENRNASKSWVNKDNSFPELMYTVFIELLKRKSEIQDNIVFFDVGAAEGCYSCSVVEYFEKCSIVSFEPELPRLEVFMENLSSYIKKFNREPDNFNIQIHEKLVTDGAAETLTMRHFVCPNTGGGAGSSSIVKFDRPNRIAIDVEYEATKLDDFIDTYENVDIVKIDVEGAEIQVLKGAKRFFNKFRPVGFLEIHSAPQNGSVTIEDVKKIVDTYDVDYELKCIETHPAPQLSYYIMKPKK